MPDGAQWAFWKKRQSKLITGAKRVMVYVCVFVDRRSFATSCDVCGADLLVLWTMSFFCHTKRCVVYWEGMMEVFLFRVLRARRRLRAGIRPQSVLIKVIEKHMIQSPCLSISSLHSRIPGIYLYVFHSSSWKLLQGGEHGSFSEETEICAHNVPLRTGIVPTQKGEYIKIRLCAWWNTDLVWNKFSVFTNVWFWCLEKGLIKLESEIFVHQFHPEKRILERKVLFARARWGRPTNTLEAHNALDRTDDARTVTSVLQMFHNVSCD